MKSISGVNEYYDGQFDNNNSDYNLLKREELSPSKTNYHYNSIQNFSNAPNFSYLHTIPVSGLLTNSFYYNNSSNSTNVPYIQSNCYAAQTSPYLSNFASSSGSTSCNNSTNNLDINWNYIGNGTECFKSLSYAQCQPSQNTSTLQSSSSSCSSTIQDLQNKHSTTSSNGNIKDEKYLVRRQKNNLAAKKCRDNKKQKSQEMQQLVSRYEQENAQLQDKILSLKSQISQIRQQLA